MLLRPGTRRTRGCARGLTCGPPSGAATGVGYGWVGTNDDRSRAVHARLYASADLTTSVNLLVENMKFANVPGIYTQPYKPLIAATLDAWRSGLESSELGKHLKAATKDSPR